MAKMLTIQLLVDEDDETRIARGLDDMLRAASTPVDPDDADSGSWLVDWHFRREGGRLFSRPVAPDLEDSICNGTYAPGDAFA